MQLRTSTLLSLAFGALLIAAPGLDSAGDGGLSYDQASAAKGGNGKGGGGNGKGGGKGASSQSASKGGSKSPKSSNSTEDVSVASLEGSSKKVKGPDHPSSLGRWNATKDFDHPSIQAHIRNGNFNGTMGMLARFGLALNTLGTAQEQTAEAEAAITELSALLQEMGYGIVDPTLDPTLDPTTTFDLDAAIADYQADMELDGAVPDQHITDLIDTVQNAPTEDDLTTAEAELTAAEAEMAAASNRSSWEEVRSVVIGRLGLTDPTATDTTEPTESPEPAEPTSEPDPVTELTP
jgi:hypothetical protein